MKMLKSTVLLLALAGSLPITATADTADIWLNTKAKTALMTGDGFCVRGVNVETSNGEVTVHGKVKTEAEKERAAAAVRAIEGVKNVRNLLQVVADAPADSSRAPDEAVKSRVMAALRADKTLETIRVSAVNNGVVILSGRVSNPADKLRAIELVWKVEGVSRVSSDIEIAGN